jgi:glutamine amidotransferase
VFLFHPKIAIIDYGVGNLLSVKKGLENVGAKPTITENVKRALSFDAVVLPGVGAFEPAMNFLSPHISAIREAVEGGLPILGICLGMQLFFTESSEGGKVEGLNFISGKVAQLPKTVKVPQMGWNTLEIVKNDPMLNDVENGEFVYFAHSYYSIPKDRSIILSTTEYGVKFASTVRKGNLIGTQFHPEKSGKVGLILLKNFVELVRGGGNVST